MEVITAKTWIRLQKPTKDRDVVIDVQCKIINRLMNARGQMRGETATDVDKLLLLRRGIKLFRKELDNPRPLKNLMEQCSISDLESSIRFLKRRITKGINTI